MLHSFSWRVPRTKWTYLPRTGVPPSGFGLCSRSPELQSQATSRLWTDTSQICLPKAGLCHRPEPELWLLDGTGCGRRLDRQVDAMPSTRQDCTRGGKQRETDPRPRTDSPNCTPALSSGKSENSKFEPNLPGHYEDTIVKVGGKDKFHINSH